MCVIGREGLTEDTWGALTGGDEELEDEQEIQLITSLMDALVVKLKLLDDVWRQLPPATTLRRVHQNCLPMK
jgi:hypothetical protein